jgi:uncharacterized membrane protein
VLKLNTRISGKNVKSTGSPSGGFSLYGSVFMKNLSKYFVNGMLVLIPITTTFAVVWGFIHYTDDFIARHLTIQTPPGVGLIIILGLILFIGWLSTYWIARKFVEWGEQILGTIPIIKTIYSSVKQMSAAVFDLRKMLQQAVLVPYPHPGVRSLGFMMGEVDEPIKSALPEDSVCVFIPISINLTGGFNIFVPVKDVVRLNITSESAIQYVLTAGAYMPRENTDEKRTVTSSH